MSRQIDLSRPLTDEDIAYLTARNKYDVIALAQQLQRERETETVEVDEPYDSWKVDVLRDELKNRKLSVEGKKDELVARLEQDDAAHS